MFQLRSRQMTLAIAATLALPLACVAPTALFAQATGTVSGTVTDSTGAAIPKASVVFHNNETNDDRSTTADGSGVYTLPNLQPGNYTLTVTAPGFGTYKQTTQIYVGTRIDINPKLAVNSSVETVNVSTDSSATVNTASAEVSQVINQQQISQLPSLTRNPYDFVALSGNVSAGDNTSSGHYQNGATSERGVGFSLNGGRNSGTEVLLDGVENLSIFTDSIATIVPLDDVQEYRVITNNFAPEYGRASGGVVAVATRSGSNSFHGRLWEFNRLSAYTANTVTNAQAGVARSPYTRNQFGGIVGGPIKRDKLFFFASTELTRVRSTSNTISVVPTDQLIAASAANVQSYFAAYGAHPAFNVISTTTNLQAGGGTSPLYPQLSPTLPVFSNVQFGAPQDAGGGLPQNTYNVTGRLDWNLSPKTQAFFRYVDYNENDFSGAAFASPYTQYNVGQTTTSNAYLLSVAHEFNTALSTLTKLSFNRSNFEALSYNTALQNTPTLFIRNSAVDPYTANPFQLPGFYDTNAGNGGLPAGGPQNTIQYNQDLTWTVGKHQMQFGGQLLYIQENYGYGAYAQGAEQLGNNAAQGFSNLLSGNLYQFQVAVNPQGVLPCARNPYTGALVNTSTCQIQLPASAPNFARSDRFHDWAGYGQDQFKITPRLTLNYGVRYEYFGVQHNNNANLDSNFYYGSGSNLFQQIRSGQVLTAPKSPNGRLWNPQYGTVSPRVGFALDVFGNGKTSLRGGYGISYERNFGNVTFNLIQNPPNYAVVVVNSGGTGPQPVVSANNLGPLATTTPGATSVSLPPTSLRQVDPNIRAAQTQFHSLVIDQQIAHNTLLEVSYNGSRGLHLYDIKNYNIAGFGNTYLGDTPVNPSGSTAPVRTRLNPQFSNINNRGSNGDSYYNAVNVQLTAQDIRHTGLSVVANYTFAHALDDLSTTFSETYGGNFSLGYTDPFNPALDHGNSDFDIRNRFILAPIYRTPWFDHRKGGAIAQALFGWEVTGIYSVRTGTPFTFYDSTNNLSGYGIPRYNPVTPVLRTRYTAIPKGQANSGNLYTLTGATDLPLDNAFGNAALGGISDVGPYPATMTARNIFRGPGAYNLDASVSKTFPIHEQINLEFRAEGFDITNHHNLYILGQNLDAANFAAFTSTSPLGSTIFNPEVNPQIQGRKGGVIGGANDERRFGQFALKVNF